MDSIPSPVIDPASLMIVEEHEKQITAIEQMEIDLRVKEHNLL